MPKIDKTDLENISLIKRELKFKNITSVKIKKGDYEIELSTVNNSSAISIAPAAPQEEKFKPKNENKELISNPENVVKCPMVGVAYLSSDPSSSPYIKVGQHVKQGDTIALIEAMKTFNEIRSTHTGIVKKILISNGKPVEYGEHLIIIE